MPPDPGCAIVSYDKVSWYESVKHALSARHGLTQQMVLQIVREKVFERLRQELPYEIEVKAVGQRQLADGSLRFDQTVVVPTEMVGLLYFDLQVLDQDWISGLGAEF